MDVKAPAPVQDPMLDVLKKQAQDDVVKATQDRLSQETLELMRRFGGRARMAGVPGLAPPPTLLPMPELLGR